MPLADPDALDRLLAASLRSLRGAIDRWMAALLPRDGWRWRDWFDWSEGRPLGALRVLTVDAPDAIGDRIGELYAIADATPFHLELERPGTFLLSVDSWTHPALARRVRERLELRWVRTLVQPELAAVHREVFDWFAHRGDTLQRLHWRELEQVVAASFEAQGMTVTLGPGRADDGIDLTLARHEVFGDVLTAVQVRGGRTPVRLHYVQALAAASLADGDDEALFVTAARYLPGARRWAEAWEASTRRRLTLATPEDVELWSAAARDRTWLPDSGLRDPAPRGAGPLVGKVLVATLPSGLVHRFGLVLRQTRRAVLMRMLQTEPTEGDSMRGLSRPVVPADLHAAPPATLVAARRPEGAGGERHVGIDGLDYRSWDGRPKLFDWTTPAAAATARDRRVNPRIAGMTR